ncbi:GNAT superfamily N-acetyltransferase [Lutibacter sp. SG786]|nr:GNAT superfamily N-acetyltransferase [Luteibacter sp. SG786]
MPADYLIRPIEPRDDADIAAVIRTVMPEFGADGPGFAIHDAEVDAMSAAYSRPRTAYFVVEMNGRAVGGGGMAPLEGGDEETCELRKMYFLPEARGTGAASQLLRRCLDAARRAGFSRCYLETLTGMDAAQALYLRHGFTRIDAPMGGTGHFACDRFFLRSLNDGDLTVAPPPPSLVFAVDDPGRPDVLPLIEQLHGYLSDLDRHLPPPSVGVESLRQPHTTFMTARVDGLPLACGAAVDHGEYVELKYMYVLPACRGMGLGKQMLEALEQQVLSAGGKTVKLETGPAQTESIELYERAGYRRCRPFGDYRASASSIFMEKSL